MKGATNSLVTTERTNAVIAKLKDSGINLQELASVNAFWDKDFAESSINSLFLKYDGAIEAIISNNDAMAIGAIKSLQKYGYNKGDNSKYIPVVGVDATAPALQAMKDGSLLGTVLNDAESQGKATVNIALAAAQGKEINKENVGYDVTDGKYVWIDYVKVTQDNYQKYIK